LEAILTSEKLAADQNGMDVAGFSVFGACSSHAPVIDQYNFLSRLMENQRESVRNTIF
jgi:hypothetical protein